VLSPGCTVDVLNTEIQVNLFLTEESRHFSIDLIVALFPGHSSGNVWNLKVTTSKKVKLV
jgi:hypothetical protein